MAAVLAEGPSICQDQRALEAVELAMVAMAPRLPRLELMVSAVVVEVVAL